MPEGFMRDYVGVDERHDKFLDKYPEGRVQCSKPEIVEVAGQYFILSSATIWRTPDDPHPSIAWAWQEFPGPTNFTRKSEAMNAETSAVGRALAWIGIETKRGIASQQEMRGLDHSRESHPPAPPADWREKFKAACAEANVDLTEVCLEASDGKLSLPDQFRDEERFKLGECLKRLKSGGIPVPPGAGAEDAPSVLGSKARH